MIQLSTQSNAMQQQWLQCAALRRALLHIKRALRGATAAGNTNAFGQSVGGQVAKHDANGNAMVGVAGAFAPADFNDPERRVLFT